MAMDEFKGFYLSLDNTGKARLLALLAFDLSIAARDTYAVGTEDLADPRRMRQVNELQHHVLDRLSSLLDSGEAWDEELFADSLVAERDACRCGSAFRKSMEFLRSHLSVSPVKRAV